MDRNDMIFEILQNLDRKLDTSTESLTRIQANLTYHIKRTDLLEQQMSTKANKLTLRQGAAIIGIIGTILGIYLKLTGFL